MADPKPSAVLFDTLPCMSIDVVVLSETLVAGLAVRTKNDNEKDPTSGWLMKTWERIGKKQYTDSIAAVLSDYESDSNGYYTEVIGHEIATPDDLKPGEVLAKVPSDTYAKFTVTGEMPGIVLEAWQKVWQAEADGSIQRSYATDLERYPSPGTVELFVSVANN
ncbi:MAG TPA: effector binding domain-containing protein [Candidatus Polarisedimenticolaceae bacterium]|nr:effector binding domain-containing protein [Candidatus Polarisedimenticolaceae bacterium]